MNLKKIKRGFALLLLTGILLSGCTSTASSGTNGVDQKDTNEKNTASIAPNIDYSKLEGDWLSSPKSQIASLNRSLGGIILSIHEANSNIIEGEIAYIQIPPSNKTAVVTFSFKPSQNPYEFDFDDDGFGTSGHCKITLLDSDRIQITLKSNGKSSSNQSGWYMHDIDAVFTKAKEFKGDDYYRQLILEFEQATVDAINNKNFDLVSPYIIPDSPLYYSHKERVKELSGQTENVKLVNFKIESIVDYNDNGKDSKRIKVHEAFELSYPSSKTVKEYDYYYYAGKELSGREEYLKLYDMSALNESRVDNRERMSPDEVLSRLGSGYRFEGVDYVTGRYHVIWLDESGILGISEEIDPYTGDIYVLGNKTGNIKEKGNNNTGQPAQTPEVRTAEYTLDEIKTKLGKNYIYLSENPENSMYIFRWDGSKDGQMHYWQVDPLTGDIYNYPSNHPIQGIVGNINSKKPTPNQKYSVTTMKEVLSQNKRLKCYYEGFDDKTNRYVVTVETGDEPVYKLYIDLDNGNVYDSTGLQVGNLDNVGKL